MGDGEDRDPVRLEGDPTAWIENNPSSAANVKTLQLFNFHEGSLEAIAKLYSLVRLEFYLCRFEQLPFSFGQLLNLAELKLEKCEFLKCIPNNLRNLNALILKGCSLLVELPSNLKISNLTLLDCFHSRTLIRPSLKLQSLSVVLCSYSLEEVSKRLSKLKDLKQIIIRGCDIHLRKIRAFPRITDCSSLDVLYLDNNPYLQIKSFYVESSSWNESPPCNLLPPLSLKILPQLSLMILPRDFRLETLPNDMKDSAVICVQGKQVRKTFKELREDGDFYPIQDVSPCPYLRLEGNPSVFNHDFDYSEELQKMVLILDLELSNDSGPKVGLDNHEVHIDKLVKVTHLYITGSKYLQQHIPDTFTELKHLSLVDCDIDSHPSILSNLRLDYLHLDLLGEDWPDSLTLPVTLKHLCLQRCNMESFLTRIERLTDLKMLDLYECQKLSSLPQNLNFFKLKLVNSNIVFKSVPDSITHVEVIHFSYLYCDGKICSNNLEFCLKHLVNLESVLITCPKIKWLPPIKQGRLRNLILRDCFSLTHLPILEETSTLCSLDISGTRITSVPDSLLKLPRLQLILPKCLLIKLTETSIIDETNELYYQLMGFHDINFSIVNEAETSNQSENVKGRQKMSVLDCVSNEDAGEPPTKKKKRGIGYIAQVGGDSFLEHTFLEHAFLEHTSKASRIPAELKTNIIEEEIYKKIYEGKTIDEAAEELKVSRSTLKRRVKEYCISWPRFYGRKRQRKDEASNVSADNQNRDTAKQKHKQLQGDEGSHSLGQVRGDEGPNVSTYDQQIDKVNHNQTLKLKLAYNGYTVRIDLPQTSNVEDLKKELSQKIGLQEENIKVSYLDEENDRILVADMQDLNRAVNLANGSGEKYVKLIVDISHIS